MKGDNSSDMIQQFLLSAALFSAAALLSAADTLPTVPANPNVRVIEEIVAKVNNDIITRGELERQRVQIEAEIRQQKGLSGEELTKEVKQKQADALREKIDQLLLVQKGKDLNINVDPEITRQLADIQVEQKISDPDKFHEWVSQASGGLSFEDVRQNMKDQLITRKVVSQEVGSKISVPQPEIQKYYDDHKAEFVRQEMVFLREILIKPTVDTPAGLTAAKKKADEIVVRARNNEKFSLLVRDYSAAETAKNDGDLPPYKRGEMPKEMEDSVFTKTKGYITDPMKVASGYLILRVEDHYAAGQASIDDVKNEIMDHLYTPQMQPKLRSYLTQLRQDAFLEIRGGYSDSGAAPGKDTSWKDPSVLKPQTTTKEEVAARKHKKKMLGVGVPFTSSTPKQAPAAPTVTPTPQAPVTPPNQQ